MASAFLQQLFSRSRWHLVRVLQLLTGTFLTGSYFLGFPDRGHLALGLLLLLMAVVDISCPFGNSCRIRR